MEGTLITEHNHLISTIQCPGTSKDKRRGSSTGRQGVKGGQVARVQVSSSVTKKPLQQQWVSEAGHKPLQLPEFELKIVKSENNLEKG
jgi:hypothetical protein